MKKVSLIIFYVMIFVLATCSVNAQCTNEEIDNLKKEANKIKVTYKHLGAVENDEGITVYDKFNVTFKNISDDLYIEMFNFSYVKHPENGTIVDTFTTGNWNFDIYSDKCEERISSINVYLPKFNIYSLDPLCKDIDVEEFALCGKYYEYDISYEAFKEKVVIYRNNHKIIEKNALVVADKNLSYYLNFIYDFIVNNFIYFIIGTIIIFSFIIFSIANKKRRSRGVLK